MSKAFLIILFLVIGIFVGGYYLLSQTMTPVQPITNARSTSTITQAMSPSTAPSQGAVETAIPAGWKTYTSSTYGFSIQHPADVIQNTNQNHQKTVDIMLSTLKF